MKNAFNECRREAFLHRIQIDFPQLFAWVQWSYVCAAELRFGTHCLSSTAGVQQGDPLGPLLFSSVLMELQDGIRDIPGIEAQMWYLDDGTFVGSREAVSTLFEELVEKGPKFGVYVNISKCEVFWPSGDQEFQGIDSRVRRVNITSYGSELLGSPIVGTRDYFDEFFKQRVDHILHCQSKLSDLDDPQIEMHLLRSCLSLCKLNHLLRTTPPAVAQIQLERFDSGQRQCLQMILGSSISDQSWIQATLPMRMGGLGLREATRTAPAAFLGSCRSTRSLAFHLISRDPQGLSLPDSTLVGEDAAIREFNSLFESSVEENYSQHDLQNVLDNALTNHIMANSSLRDQARLNTVRTPHAGSWLRAIPNPKLGLSMTKQECVTACKVWLGLPLFPPPCRGIRCICGKVLDEFGDHLLGCGRRALRTKRHNALRDIIFHHVLSDNSDCKLEQGCSSSNYKIPGDIFHPDFLDGRSGYFDVTVRNSMLPQFISPAASQPGAAAEAGEKEKDGKHNDDVTKAGSMFYPLVLETLGFWSPHSLKTLKVIAKRAAIYNNITSSQAVCNLHEQLSVTLWKFNARMLLDRLILEGNTVASFGQ